MTPGAQSRFWRGIGTRLLHGDNEVDTIVRFLSIAVALGYLAIALAEAENSTSALALERLLVSLLDISLLLTVIYAPRVGTTAIKLVSVVLLLGGLTHLLPLSIAALAAALVLVSKRMYRWYVSLTLVYMGPMIVMTLFGAPEMRLYSLSVYILSWVTASLLGFGFALAQSRLEREIARRVADMRAAEQTLMQTRLSFALDTHDTVSHALARESATLRLALRVPDLPDDGSAMIRSALEANTEAQVRLRELLARLHETPGPQVDSVDLSTRLAALHEALSQEMAQLGVAFTSSFSVPAATLPRTEVETIESILRELCTNIVKHADLSAPIELRIETPGDHMLRFTTRNVARDGQRIAPRSVWERAKALGGQCVIEQDPPDEVRGRIVTVNVTIPIPQPESPNTDVAAVRTRQRSHVQTVGELRE